MKDKSNHDLLRVVGMVCLVVIMALFVFVITYPVQVEGKVGVSGLNSTVPLVNTHFETQWVSVEGKVTLPAYMVWGIVGGRS